METSLVLGSQQRPMGLRFQERLHNKDSDVSLLVDGVLGSSTGKLQVRGVAFKGFDLSGVDNFKNLVDRVEVGVSYASDRDDFFGTLRAKKKFAFGKGSGAGTVKLVAQADMNKDRKVEKYGRAEVCSKVFNFTNKQDLKLKVGFGHKRIGVSSNFLQGPYGVVQENNWSLLTDFQKYWQVTYRL
uniref:Uncharacterized protein n=1 Tax=Tetraselmis sp. GSL018 TaxID=582737 RepID=A0A061QPX8_9CHLO|mmetsp:Transcript_10214/g.24365  ORF Transcript_10214/g.24365 Transcript_10214/m.24365 type:complete len:185 (+) Transcript_10214:141-695(+)